MEISTLITKRALQDTLQILRAAGLSLLITLPFPAAASDPFTAKVTSVLGSARCTTNELNWYALRPADEVASPSTIHTAVDDSSVDLMLSRLGAGGASIVRIFSNSLLRINALRSKRSGDAERKEIQLDLVSGQILGTVDSTYEYQIQGADQNLMRVATYPGATNRQDGVYVFKASGTLLVLSGALTVATVDPTGVVITQVVTNGQRFSAGSRDITKLEADAPERKLWP